MQAAKAPRKLCESKPGLYKKIIGVFEAAQLSGSSLIALPPTIMEVDLLEHYFPLQKGGCPLP